MKQYIFNFNVVPTDNSWWSSYRNESITVDAENVKQAIQAFCEILKNGYCLDVSKTAQERPPKMYRDTTNGVQQTGYVFKASTEVDFDRRWIKKYADIWAEINELTIPFN